jgi:hypothetical protein
MLRLAACAVVVLAGCDSVFGLTPITYTPDASASRVTGSFKQTYIANDETFAPMIVDRVLPNGAISFGARLDDGTDVEVDYNADGTFAFPIAREGQRYRFFYTMNGVRSELQTDAAQLKVGGLVGGRPDPRAVAQATVQFPFPIMGATTYGAFIASTGVYSFTYSGSFGPTVSFDWRLAAPAPGSTLGLLDASKHDRLYALEMQVDSTIANLPYSSIKGVSSASVTQVPGGVVTLTQPQAVAKNTCARLVAANVAEHDRIVAAHPRSYVSSSGDWLAYSAPFPERMGLVGANWVAVCGFSPVRDLDISPSFHDPYPGTTMVVESAAAATFNLTLPGATPNPVANITRRYAIGERGVPMPCTPAKSNLETNIALPGRFAVNGMTLDADAQVVQLDLARDVDLTWEIVAPGLFEYFLVSVYEVQNVNGATTLVPRVSFAVANHLSGKLDRTMFTAGGKYIVAVVSALGRPDIGSGDWETLRFPLESSTIWSTYFEVEAL